MVDEKALMESFANVKKDIKKLEANFLELSSSQIQIVQDLQELKNSLAEKKSKGKPSRKKR